MREIDYARLPYYSKVGKVVIIKKLRPGDAFEEMDKDILGKRWICTGANTFKPDTTDKSHNKKLVETLTKKGSSVTEFFFLRGLELEEVDQDIGDAEKIDTDFEINTGLHISDINFNTGVVNKKIKENILFKYPLISSTIAGLIISLSIFLIQYLWTLLS